MRLVYDHLLGAQFQLQSTSWYQGVPCKLISFFTLANIHCSSATTLVIVTEWYVITRFPFEASSKLNQIKLILDLHWAIPILASVLDILFLQTNHGICLFAQVDISMHLFAVVATMIVQVAMTLFPPILTVILSALTMRLINLSVIESGQEKVRSNLAVYVRLVSINACNSIRMLSVIAVFIMKSLKWTPTQYLFPFLIFLGTHVPSTVHPLLLFAHGN